MVSFKKELARIQRQISVVSEDLATLQTIVADGNEIPREPDKSGTLSVDDLARMLNVHSNTVRRWIKLGDLKPDKIGRKYVFWKSDLNKYLEALSKKQLQ